MTPFILFVVLFAAVGQSAIWYKTRLRVDAFLAVYYAIAAACFIAHNLWT